MQYFGAVYNLLASLVWSITPLPLGVAGRRLAVGTPEKIPDKDCTFVTREVSAADGIEPPAEVVRLNGFIKQALQYHTLYGLAPIQIGAFEEILDKFANVNKPIGRIRLVSHGNDAFVFCPVFKGGLWSFGMQTGFINALKDSDEAGLRFLFNSSSPSPIFVDIVAEITIAIRKKNSALLAPFGIQASGTPSAAHLPYFQIVNDLYQVKFCTVTVTDGTNKTLSTPAQQNIFNGALNRIETAQRTALTTGGGISDTQLTAFRNAVLTMPPGPSGLFAGPANLSAGVVANVAAATAASPQVEADIRSAFSGLNPVFGMNHLSSLVRGLELFNKAALKLGSTQLTLVNINANANLKSLALVGVDLFLLQNGAVLQAGTTLTNSERTTLRSGLMAMASIIRGRIVSAGTFTGAKLDTFLDALANMDPRQSTILGEAPVFKPRVQDLERATVAMQNNFRTKLVHFRSLMQASDKSAFDIRGCLVGKSTAFLDAMRAFMGTATKKPTVTAPEWFQIFTSALHLEINTTIRPDIDTFILNGEPPDLRPADLGTSMTAWRPLVDFDPHFTFIKDLFAAPSKRNFASLQWLVFKATAAPQGIPMLRLEAPRIDTLPALTKLADVIERFRAIFEIPTASMPNAATLTKLSALQPIVVRLKTASDKVAAATSPTTTQLGDFVTELSKILTDVMTVGLTAPAPPSAPGAGATLVQVKDFANKLGTHIDAILNTALNAFFTSVTGVLAHANGRHRYWYNTGAPLLVQNAAKPSQFRISTLVSPAGQPGSDLAAGALRSWMRIQWEGDAAQAATMNATINSVPITTNPEREAASRVSMLTRDNPNSTATTPAGIAPMPAFAAHIIKRPP